MEITTEGPLKFVEEVYLYTAEIHNSLIFLQKKKKKKQNIKAKQLLAKFLCAVKEGVTG